MVAPSPFPKKAQCLVCAKPRKSRGLCPKHYMQLRAQGYNVSRVPWYAKVKDFPAALALVTGVDSTTAATLGAENVQVPPALPAPVAAPAPVPVPAPAPSHDAWVAAYAYCQSKNESMDVLMNALVTDWYARTFPALARGEVLPPHAAPATSATH